MERTRISLLAITGGSCSGKDTLVNALEIVSPASFAKVDFDDYFLGSKRLEGQSITDWENPNLYRYSDYIEDLKSLKNGQSVTVECHSRKSVAAGIAQRVINPARWIVVYGFLVLYKDEAADLFDRTVYLDIPEDEMVRRRISRTTGSEGWDAQGYIRSMLIPGHRKYVVPQKNRPGILTLDGTLPSIDLAKQVLAAMK